MHRLGLAVLLLAATSACEPSKSSTTPPEPEPGATAEAQPEPQPAPELAEPQPEPEPEPEPDPDPEISEVHEPVFSKQGFEARDLHCELPIPTRHADRYIAAGLVDADAGLDACAPKGAAIEVEWTYIGGRAGEISVVAESSKLANCVAAAMGKVRAGVEGSCKVVLLLGDTEAATAAYEAR